MKLGLIADIHEDVDRLRQALDRLREAGADRLVMLGDVVEMGHRLSETVTLLREARVPGVWGNHDYGLCVDPGEEMRTRYGPEVLAYMATLTPRWIEGEVLVQHVEPRGNPEEVFDLWMFDEWPPTAEQLAADFAGFSQRRAFAGHRHCWRAVTPEGPLPWEGHEPLALPADRRCVVIVHAVADGWCGLYDAGEDVIIPLRLD
ncbi:metallophosphoesterase family protein [Tautonia rosea]|uniref:metallophosphoesterase family protein n=1 Tax=Tautonia rosea TaxID=2728037 RepID=UPI001475DD6F|nr:metallophosphoesterase family protein [Tautonia rosea]